MNKEEDEELEMELAQSVASATPFEAGRLAADVLPIHAAILSMG